MTADPESRDASVDLGAEIARIYSGPLGAFVARRNDLVNRLREAGRREDAKTVKALRKPKLAAWALNVASSEETESVESVAAAVAAALDAQTGRGDVRTSLRELRNAAHHLAVTASRIAASRGHTIDEVELANAVMAVIGSHDAFTLLASGRLVDIPEGGGLDPLTLAASTGGAGTRDAESSTEAGSQKDQGQEAKRRAERALEEARDRLAHAEKALSEAEASAQSAERKLRQAEDEARARQADAERARETAKTAADQVVGAEEALAKARADVGGTD